MGSSASCNDSVSLSIGFKSCLYSLTCVESCAKHEHHTSNDTEDNLKVIFLEDLESSTTDDEEDFNGSTVQEFVFPHCDTLHIHDSLEPLCVSHTTVNEDEISDQKEVEPHSFDTDIFKSLSEFASILCSEVKQLYTVTSDAGVALSCTTIHNEYVSKAETPAFVQPLPTTPKLVSALKGSRAQQGKVLTTSLSVKWAPEVYDPTVTSSSHTVKSGHHRHHRHRPKAKREYQNHGYSKGKSSKGSVGERNHARRRSSSSNLIDPRILRLQARGCSNRPVLNSCGQSKIESLDLPDRSQVAVKFGTGCYTELLAPLQPPVAEAS